MKLVPLEVFAGWVVKMNHFYAVLPEEVVIDNFLGYPFHEDILHAVHPGGLAIDLGWFPDCDPKGAYKVSLMRAAKKIPRGIKQSIKRKFEGVTYRYNLDIPVEIDWNNPIETYSSRDYKLIQDKLNEYFYRILHNN